MRLQMRGQGLRGCESWKVGLHAIGNKASSEEGAVLPAVDAWYHLLPQQLYHGLFARLDACLEERWVDGDRAKSAQLKTSHP